LLATPGGHSRDDLIAAGEDQHNRAAMLSMRQLSPLHPHYLDSFRLIVQTLHT
jgi:hypothetical protein